MQAAIFWIQPIDTLRVLLKNGSVDSFESNRDHFVVATEYSLRDGTGVPNLQATTAKT